MAGIGPSSSTSGLCGGLTDAVGFDTYDGYVTADASSAGINVFDGAWHYLVGSYTAAGGGSVSIYLDGRLLLSPDLLLPPFPSLPLSRAGTHSCYPCWS